MHGMESGGETKGREEPPQTPLEQQLLRREENRADDQVSRAKEVA
jgi:hypothetical protein